MRLRFSIILLAAAGLLAYHNSFRIPFLFDDEAILYGNPSLPHPLWAPSYTLSAPPPLAAIIYRPLFNLSLALNYALSGYDVWSYHAFNLLLHLLSALVLFGWIRRTLQTPRLQNRTHLPAELLAFVSSLIWVLHPLNTSTVILIARRSELLADLFYLLCLYSLVRGTRSAHPWKTVCVASCALGMLSKPTMISAPLMAVFYDRCFLAPSFSEVIRKRWRLHLGLAATWAILLGILFASPDPGDFGFRLSNLRFWDYLRMQPGILLRYLRLSFWPYPLVLDYDWPVAESLSSFLPKTLLLLGLLLATARAFRRRPETAFLGIWFFLLLAPTSLLPFRLEIAAEHRMYLPLAGIVTGSAAAGYALLRKKRWVAMAAAVGIAGLFCRMTIARNRDYRTNVSIWSDTVKKRPHHGMAYYNLGVALLKEQKTEEAIQAFRQATRLGIGPLRPRDETGFVYYNLGVSFLKRQQWEEAVEAFTRAAQIIPSHHPTEYNLGFAMERAGLLRLADHPRDSAVHLYLGVAYGKQRKFNQAVEHFLEAIRLDPNNALAQTYLKTAREKLRE